jgi:RecA-family ATPase
MADLEKLLAELGPEPRQPKPMGVVRPMPRKAISVGDLLSKAFPPTNYIIGSGLLNQGSIMFIGGPPKSYKSFMMNTLLISLVTGKNLFGAIRKPAGGRHKSQEVFPIPVPQRVLLLEQEVGEEDLQQRFLPIVNSLIPAEQKLCIENMFVHSCDYNMLLDTIEGRKYISGIIKDIKPTILAFDPLIEFHTSNENDTQAMARIMHNITVLRQDHKLSTIVNHHTSKPSQESPRRGPDLLRGSSVMFGKGDTFLMLGKTERELEVKVDFTLRRAKPLSNAYVRLNDKTLMFEFVRWAMTRKADPSVEQVLEDLEEE